MDTPPDIRAQRRGPAFFAPLALAPLALVGASILWGTTGTAAAFLPPAVTPVAIGASTMAIGGLLLFIVSARPALAALRAPSARRWLFLGAVGVFVYPLAFYSAMNLAGVAIGNVIALGSGPVFAALFEWIGERQRLSRRGALSTSAAVVGVILLGIFGTTDDGASGGNVPVGAALGLLAGASYALYTYSSTRAIRAGSTARAVIGATFGIGATALLPVLLVVGAPLLATPTTLAIAAYLALGPMFIAYLLFGIGLGSLRSSTVTTITLLEPVVATLLAVVVLSERLTIAGWGAVAVIIAGVAVLATASPGDAAPRQESATPPAE